MLTPEYLAGCTSYLLGMMDALDRTIIADISRRIVKTGVVTPTAKDQADKVQQSGMLLSDVIQQVAVTTTKSDEEIERLFQDASIEGLQNDVRPLVLAGQNIDVSLSPAMQQILQASIDKTNGDVRNLSMTLGSTAANKYIEAVNAATMKVQSGTFSYAQAIRDAVKEAADDGNWVTYASGHRDRLDVAIRRAVLTGVNQTAARLTEMNAEALGAEYYETTAHAGARPSHTVWQGRVFKIHGETEEYPNFEDKTGYGTGAGLCGWNCRHSFYPFWPGISVPAYTQEMLDSYKEAKFSYNGKKMTEYEVSQEMRGMERDIRETKREIAGLQAAYDAAEDPKLKADLKADLEKASVRLKQQEAKYRDLCKQTSHKPDTVRTGVTAFKDEKGNILAFNQSAAQRARWTAKKASSVSATTPTEKPKTTSASTPSAKGKTPTVIEKDSVTIDGVTYKVDGKHVFVDHTDYEKNIAHVLSDTFQKDVELVPRVVYPQKVSTPDYLIGGKKYDLKTIRGTSKNAIYNAISKKERQAENFVLDISQSTQTEDDLYEQAERIFMSSHTRFVQSIVFVKNGKVIRIFNRKK